MGYIIHPVTGAKITVHGPDMGPKDATPHQPDRKYTEKQSKKIDDKKQINEAMKKPKLGTGERFKKLEGKLDRKGIENPAGLAAYIGRKKMGKEKFQNLASKGKK